MCVESLRFWRCRYFDEDSFLVKIPARYLNYTFNFTRFETTFLARVNFSLKKYFSEASANTFRKIFFVYISYFLNSYYLCIVFVQYEHSRNLEENIWRTVKCTYIVFIYFMQIYKNVCIYYICTFLLIYIVISIPDVFCIHVLQWLSKCYTLWSCEQYTVFLYIMYTSHLNNFY